LETALALVAWVTCQGVEKVHRDIPCGQQLKLYTNMEIKKIIQEGEKLSAKQLVDICGGAAMMDNTNDAVITCKCSGSGDNTNTGLWCSCKDDLRKIKDPDKPDEDPVR
jgi:hypothetical protein